MKRLIRKGATSVSLDVFIQDSTSTAGAGLTGLVFNSAGLVCYYRRGGTGTVTQLNLATQTVGGAHSDGGFVELSAANMPGMYRLDLSNAVVASGAPYVSLMLKGATNMAPLPIELQLVDFDPEDAVRLGLSALPNAAAQAAGGLYTRGTGAGQINQGANGQIDVNVERLANVVQSLTDLKDFADDGYDPAANKVEGVKLVDTTTVNTDMRGTNNAALATVATEARLAELDAANIPADVDTLKARITATLFAGITALAEWLGAIAGKQSANATARTEIRATGAGSGTYDETTDSLEAIRDTAPLGTAMRGTDNAALASVCTEARLAELDAANLPTDVAAVQSDLPTKITRNTALAAFPFPMVLSSDHITPATGLTVTAVRSIDGAAFAPCANAVVEVANGWYRIDLAASDLNGNTVALRFTAAAADARNITIVTQAT